MFDRVKVWGRERLIRAVDEAVCARLDARMEQHERWLQGQVDRILDTVDEHDRLRQRDIFRAAERLAVESSARFAYEHFPTAEFFHHPHATLEHAVKTAPDEGMALEFGVYSGTTLEIIARLRGGRRPCYGFDSFEGLPEDWRSAFPASTFAVENPPAVPGAELVVGWFEDTLPTFLDEHRGPVAFVHVDCDLYSSTTTVLDLVGPRLVEGSVIVFDEYFNYPGWERHEHRAWQEYVERTGTEFVHEAYTVDHEQVAMRITHPGAAKPHRT